MNQYQACLYLFQCISHGDSKYSNQIPECWHFLQKLLHFLPVVCTRLLCSWWSLNWSTSFSPETNSCIRLRFPPLFLNLKQLFDSCHVIIWDNNNMLKLKANILIIFNDFSWKNKLVWNKTAIYIVFIGTVCIHRILIQNLSIEVKLTQQLIS